MAMSEESKAKHLAHLDKYLQDRKNKEEKMAKVAFSAVLTFLAFKVLFALSIFAGIILGIIWLFNNI
jgi:hypothetical protein